MMEKKTKGSKPLSVSSDSGKKKVFRGHKRRFQEMCEEALKDEKPADSDHQSKLTRFSSSLLSTPSASLNSDAEILDLSFQCSPQSMNPDNKEGLSNNNENESHRTPFRSPTPLIVPCSCESCINVHELNPLSVEDLPRCLTPLDPGSSQDSSHMEDGYFGRSPTDHYSVSSDDELESNNEPHLEIIGSLPSSQLDISVERDFISTKKTTDDSTNLNNKPPVVHFDMNDFESFHKIGLFSINSLSNLGKNINENNSLNNYKNLITESNGKHQHHNDYYLCSLENQKALTPPSSSHPTGIFPSCEINSNLQPQSGPVSNSFPKDFHSVFPKTKNIDGNMPTPKESLIHSHLYPALQKQAKNVILNQSISLSHSNNLTDNSTYSNDILPNKVGGQKLLSQLLARSSDVPVAVSQTISSSHDTVSSPFNLSQPSSVSSLASTILAPKVSNSTLVSNAISTPLSISQIAPLIPQSIISGSSSAAQKSNPVIQVVVMNFVNGKMPESLPNPPRVSRQVDQFQPIAPAPSSSDRKAKSHQVFTKANSNSKKTHKCTVPDCTKAYSKSSHLKAHMRTHTGEIYFIERSSLNIYF